MDAEDRHLCIVCNQTISGLLNYVLHRKNNCADQKTLGDNGYIPDTAITFQAKDLENKRGNITESQSSVNEAIKIGQENEGQTIILLQDDLSVGVQSEKSNLSLVKNEVTNLDQKNYEKVIQVSNLSCGNYDNNVSTLLDSNEERKTRDDSVNEYISDSEILSFAHNIDNQSDSVSDANQFAEKFGEGEVSDNIESVIFETVSFEESEPDVDKTNENTDLPDDSSVKPEFGILSFVVNGSSNKEIPLDVEDDCENTNSKEKIKGENRQNNKRKKAKTKDGYKRNDENTPKRRRPNTLEAHDKTRNKQHENQEDNRSSIEETKDSKVNSLNDSNKTNGVENVEHGEKRENVLPGFESDPVCIKVEINNSDNVSLDKRDAQSMNETLSCTECDQLFPNKQKLLTHLLTGHNKLPGDGKEWQYFDQVEINQRAIIKESPFRCDVCMFYFNSSIYLEQHLESKTHEENFATIDASIMCSMCKFVAKSNNQLISHFQSQNHVENMKQNNKVCAITVRKFQKKKFKVCKICPSEFHKSSSSRLHYRTAEHIRRKLASNREEEILKEEVEEENSNDEIESESPNFTDLDTRKEDIMPENNNQLNGYENQKMKGIDNEVPMITSYAIDNDSASLFWENEKLYSNQNEPKLSNNLKTLSVCKFCAFETRNYNEMRVHYMKFHSQMVKICEVCDVVFPHGRGYKLHVNGKEHQMNLKKFGNKNLFECHVCNKKFAEESYAKFHTAYYHFHVNSEGDLIKDGRESITRTKYADFLDKIKGHGKNDLLPCPECNVSLKKTNIIGHLRLHTGEKPFKCNLCSETFCNSFSLRRHLVLHFENWEKECEVCGESFKCRSSYNCHMQVHKAKVTGSGKTNVCHICGDAFYVKKKLKEHMYVHNEKTLKCNVPGCLWAFSNNHALKRHMLTHTDESPFICATCGYATKSEKYLKKHEEIHTKAKDFHCEHCSYKTMTRTHLRRHMRIHLGIKPFKCPYCSYACSTHDNIRKHILETSYHKGLKVYPCTLCSFSTNSTNEYRAHIRLEHKEIPDEHLRGGLAVISGLYNKDEETKAITECKEILPCKVRKPSRRKTSKSKDDNVEALGQDIVIEPGKLFEDVGNL